MLLPGRKRQLDTDRSEVEKRTAYCPVVDVWTNILPREPSLMIAGLVPEAGADGENDAAEVTGL